MNVRAGLRCQRSGTTAKLHGLFKSGSCQYKLSAYLPLGGWGLGTSVFQTPYKTRKKSSDRGTRRGGPFLASVREGHISGHNRANATVAASTVRCRQTGMIGNVASYRSSSVTGLRLADRR